MLLKVMALPSLLLIDRKMPNSSFNLVVLISGGGSNLQAIIDAIQNDHLNASIATVICDNAQAYGIKRAKQAKIPVFIMSREKFNSREDFDAALINKIETINPDLIVLAGFMQILGGNLVNRFRGKIINIHPSLLPAHKGLDTHQRAIDAGDRIHGATVHYVTEKLDAGPIILQASVDVQDDDCAQSLQVKVLKQEHRIYPEAIELIARKKISFTQPKI
jgi:phosphoribosylglycinamide formyltransferase-1